jgi:uncharacterized membrane protein
MSSWIISLCVVLLNVAYVLGIMVGQTHPEPKALAQAIAITIIVAVVCVVGCSARAILDRWLK